ncbi:hypothetical protein LR48_Vigan499s003500 [Vigna angularis]|uniref:Uncharacterized protein n=1 Tax=Phaseolus angularis TaxID=3914 RepID=A0A0L9TCJ2_PHAAN|nr:hypothetical protein LR48_Vigan499s003500 [Vigna angularis]
MVSLLMHHYPNRATAQAADQANISILHLQRIQTAEPFLLPRKSSNAFLKSPETQTNPKKASNPNRKSHSVGRCTPSLLRPIKNHGQAKSQIASAATNPKSPKPLNRRAFISQAPLQRRHPPSTPPSTRKILASRDILPHIITVIQMRHHLQQTCKSKNTTETPFATYKRATLPFSRSWRMTA